ncbi:sensor histidine kinase [Tundrisphaera lichenicola]|uniref:sensor histidine kinase n=1 Tax=Tundrisphaera lichenicola TaxID=2029860 RepID=UPI003EBA0B70
MRSIRYSILAKGLTLIAVPLIFQLTFIFVVFWIRKEGSNAELWAIHSKEVISQAQKCRVRLLTTHGLLQGYIITNDPAFEQPLMRAAATVPDEVRKLAELVRDNAAQSRLLKKIGFRSSAFLNFIDEGRAMILAGKMSQGTAAIRRNQAQQMLEELDRDFEQFLEDEHAIHALRAGIMNRSWNSLNRLLIFGGVFSVLCTVLLALLFSRNIGARIAGLTENARRLAESRELIPPIKGTDEISRLDRAFREMAMSLEDAGQREREQTKQISLRAEELASVNDQLRDKAQENEMFVYSVSHDLRSPLVNLQGFSKELGLIGRDLVRLIDVDRVPSDIRREGKRLIEVEIAESIGFIQSAVTRLAGIIDALLRLSRAGRVEYRFQVVELSEVVRRVVSALRGSIEGRNAQVNIGELPDVWGDPTAVEQVFANLIGNAVNYLDPQRPGRIDILFIESPESEDLFTNSRCNIFAVRDNGLGISDSHKSKVFSAFQRLHGDSTQGEGIGLTLVRRMVERHGGRIWFDSTVGEGSTFYVSLPSTESLTTAEGLGDTNTVSNGPFPGSRKDTSS